MAFIEEQAALRLQPDQAWPGTLRVVSLRMDYLPRDAPGDWVEQEWQGLRDPRRATVSVYARGRDYHRTLRQRLAQLAQRLDAAIDAAAAAGEIAVSPARRFSRAYTDSGPAMEVELAVRAGLGWRGKHTLALTRDAGSMFFLGELYVGAALPLTEPVAAHCGSCTACIEVCPTQAIVAPQRLDARRCISYLTIELEGAIPEELRAPMGNRIYGCDDCQLACPWNKYAQRSPLPEFDPRDGLQGGTLAQLWAWDEAEWQRRTEGSAIRRAGWRRWRRNLAVALGNAWRETGDEAVAAALAAAHEWRDAAGDALVREHIAWALGQGPRRPEG